MDEFSRRSLLGLVYEEVGLVYEAMEENVSRARSLLAKLETPFLTRITRHMDSYLYMQRSFSRLSTLFGVIKYTFPESVANPKALSASV